MLRTIIIQDLGEIVWSTTHHAIQFSIVRAVKQLFEAYPILMQSRLELNADPTGARGKDCTVQISVARYGETLGAIDAE